MIKHPRELGEVPSLFTWSEIAVEIMLGLVLAWVMIEALWPGITSEVLR